MHWCVFCELYLLNNDSLEVFCNSLMLMCNQSHSMDLNYGVSWCFTPSQPVRLYQGENYGVLIVAIHAEKVVPYIKLKTTTLKQRLNGEKRCKSEVVTGGRVCVSYHDRHSDGTVSF